MGFIEKAAGILTPGGVSDHNRPRPQAKAAGLAEVEQEVAEEQAAAIARALHEDEPHRHADLHQVAEKEAEAVPWDRPAGPRGGIKAGSITLEFRAFEGRRDPRVA